MRKQFACALLLASAGAFAQEAPVNTLAWMAGCWTQAGREAGSVEQWMAPAGGTMLGMARTVKNGKTVEFEHLVIRELEPGKLAYVAKPHNQAEAAFPAVKISDTEVVFENLQHDFPQRIIYRRDGEGMAARIEGTMKGKARAMDFPLKRGACP